MADIRQETLKRSLDGFVPEIVRELSRISGELAEKEIEANEAAERRQREWEAQQERWRREDDRRKVIAANEASQKQLAEIIRQWSERMAIEQFFQTVEARIAEATLERRELLSGRLAQARSMIGSVDPLDCLEGWVEPDSRYKTRYFDD
jgi:GTP1/Obg family GTP-binding protein